jgi:hypothetical protein
MTLKCAQYCLVGVTLLSLSSAAFGFAPTNDLLLLNTLERGQWNLRAVGAEAPLTKICLGNPEVLTQIQHSGAACERYVIRSTVNSVTVSYTCKGQGQGLTTIRKESNRIVHIQSQGIHNNAPFSFAVEGRKIGPC